MAKKDRYNLTAQEEVVTAIWKFAKDNQLNDQQFITSSDGVKVGHNAIGTALENIMAAFGYKVTSVQ